MQKASAHTVTLPFKTKTTTHWLSLVRQYPSQSTSELHKGEKKKRSSELCSCGASAPRYQVMHMDLCLLVSCIPGSFLMSCRVCQQSTHRRHMKTICAAHRSTYLLTSVLHMWRCVSCKNMFYLCFWGYVIHRTVSLLMTSHINPCSLSL